MIVSTKLFVLLTGSATTAVLGVGPHLESDLTLTAMLAAGGAVVVTGLLRVLRPVAVQD